MSGNEKAGSGRGNNRKRPFRRRGNSSNRNDDSGKNDSSSRNDIPNDKPAAQDRRFQGHGHPAASKWQDESQSRQNRGDIYKKDGERALNNDRPKWNPPKIINDPLPVPECPFCGKSIRDISTAIADRDTGVPVHFDCVTARIAKGENLDNGDVITYIGGGRFGIVNFDSRSSSKDPQDKANGGDFKIKKIIEWEDKEKKAEWRTLICERYSMN